MNWLDSLLEKSNWIGATQVGRCHFYDVVLCLDICLCCGGFDQTEGRMQWKCRRYKQQKMSQSDKSVVPRGTVMNKSRDTTEVLQSPAMECDRDGLLVWYWRRVSFLCYSRTRLKNWGLAVSWSGEMSPFCKLWLSLLQSNSNISVFFTLRDISATWPCKFISFIQRYFSFFSVPSDHFAPGSKCLSQRWELVTPVGWITK